MSCEQTSNALAFQLLYDAAFSCVLSDEAHRPTSATFRRRAAHQRDDRALFGVIQKPRRMWPRVVRERCFEPTVQEPPADAPHLPRVRANRMTRLRKAPASVQQLENSDATPIALAEGSETLDVFELRPIDASEFEAGKTVALLFHPEL